MPQSDSTSYSSIPLKVLIIGSGGREHALARKIAQSTHCEKLFVAPGNPGTAEIAHNLPLKTTDFKGIAFACFNELIDLVVIGPEVPLAEGIVDYFRDHPALEHIKIIGPEKAGAILESSKDFSKAFMQRYKITTAQSCTFSTATLTEGIAYLENHSLPIVLKADGLAAGKGVIIAETLPEAKAALTDMLVNDKFGEAGNRVVIEQFLKGIELSCFVLTDGEAWFLLPEAKDYKRIGEADTGPNTGGMGAVSPLPFADAAFMDKVKTRIIEPTIRGLQSEGILYCGFLFIGLMNVDGDPFVIEYNVRLGDPETEVILDRLEGDFLELLWATANGNLQAFLQSPSGAALKVNPDKFAVTVVLASEGYPNEFESGFPIKGMAEANALPETFVYQAATKAENGEIVTSGGRVLTVTATALNLATALERAQLGAALITFENRYFRKDIGKDVQGWER